MAHAEDGLKKRAGTMLKGAAVGEAIKKDRESDPEEFSLTYYTLDDDKNVVTTKDVLEWSDFLHKGERHVATTTVKGNRLLWWLGKPDYWISTVFLGIDHSFGQGPPLVFETMVFRRWAPWKRWLSKPLSGSFLTRVPWYLRALYNKADTELFSGYYYPRFSEWSEWSEKDCKRYSTWEEAEKGHKRMVKKWSRKA